MLNNLNNNELKMIFNSGRFFVFMFGSFFCRHHNDDN